MAEGEVEASREAEAEDHLSLPDGDGEGNRQSVKKEVRNSLMTCMQLASRPCRFGKRGRIARRAIWEAGLATGTSLLAAKLRSLRQCSTAT
jgi:hypothetical protein